MDDLYKIIEKPLITEKSTLLLQESNRVSFMVNKNANKMKIKEAVERVFKVTVLKVNTVNVKGKERIFGRKIGRTQDWKKAVLRLKEGDKIEFFEGA
ncbi:MAG: 50S ribosomal protein L23 [Nitrospinae bacterium RIFCSPLOWO2_12_FULL_47_7]|nr:MAG: 50S ribosomal protein L23 [Nitrospinae bacterium RIFCSPLOWO2_12_FULL_47_7]